MLYLGRALMQSIDLWHTACKLLWVNNLQIELALNKRIPYPCIVIINLPFILLIILHFIIAPSISRSILVLCDVILLKRWFVLCLLHRRSSLLIFWRKLNHIKISRHCVTRLIPMLQLEGNYYGLINWV